MGFRLLGVRGWGLGFRVCWCSSFGFRASARGLKQSGSSSG